MWPSGHAAGIAVGDGVTRTPSVRWETTHRTLWVCFLVTRRRLWSKSAPGVGTVPLRGSNFTGRCPAARRLRSAHRLTGTCRFILASALSHSLTPPGSFPNPLICCRDIHWPKGKQTGATQCAGRPGGPTPSSADSSAFGLFLEHRRSVLSGCDYTAEGTCPRDGAPLGSKAT